MEPLRFAYERRALYFMLAVLLLMGVPLALMWVVLALAEPTGDAIAAAVGSVAVVVVGLWAVLYWLFSWRGPVLELNDDGVAFHPWHLGPFAWADIDRAWICRGTYRGRVRSLSLCLELRDVEAYRPTRSRHLRYWRHARRDLGAGDITIPIDGLKIPDVDAVATLIQARGARVRDEAGWPEGWSPEPPVS